MYILGVSCYYHDSAAALVKNGKVIVAGAEERFSRKKHDSGFPKLAVNYCLEEANIKSSELDWVVFYEKPFLKFERITLSALATAPLTRGSFVNAYKTWIGDKLWIKSTISKIIGIDAEKILFVPHHLSHAASAFFTSHFDSSAILTCDGVGEWTTTAWGTGKSNKVILRKEIKFPHSLGLFYSAFTQYLGFQINEGEFKVMGLAPYGAPSQVEKVRKLIYQSANGAFKLDLSYFNYHLSDRISYSKKFVDLLGLPPVNSKDSDRVQKKYADIAASAQLVLDEALVTIAKQIKNETGEKNLCYSGGVALNGVTNWKIFEEAGFKNVFIHPAAGDDGGALGCALHTYYHILGNERKKVKMFNPFLGSENSNEEIEGFLRDNNIKYRKVGNSKLNKEIARYLSKGKVVGWVKGKFEWGPRALGARSILADPRSKKMKDLVNSKIKFREAFRPFAPVCLWEKGKDYFEIGSKFPQQPLEYMIAVVPVKKSKQPKLGAITHVDGTARPQFIRRNLNRNYYDVINEFGKLTGVYVLLNTSFNLKGEPIVNTVEDAYKTFMASGIDILVLEDFVVTKRKR